MNKIWKIVLPGILTLILFFGLDAWAHAASMDRHVFDEADLLTAEEESELEALAEEEYAESGIYMAVITRDDGRDVADVAHDFYEEISAEGIHDALILTVDMTAREFYFIAYNKADHLLTEYELDELYDTLGTYLSNEDFFAGFHVFLADARDLMANDRIRTDEDRTYSEHGSEDEFYHHWGFQLAVAAFIAAGVVGYMAYTAGGTVTVTEETYMDHSASKIRARRDIYLRTVVTKTKRSKSDSNSSGGFGGGISSSSRRGSF